MTKKHLIFPIHTYPDDAPEDRTSIALYDSERGRVREVYHMANGTYEECDGLVDSQLQPGDTYINLSEGEVVEKQGGMRVEGSDTIYWSFAQKKEQEGDE